MGVAALLHRTLPSFVIAGELRRNPCTRGWRV
jgi:hypothetical protein